jgi:hypothetical protein
VTIYSGKILVARKAASPKEFAYYWQQILALAETLEMSPMTDGFQGYNDENFNDDGSL